MEFGEFTALTLPPYRLTAVIPKVPSGLLKFPNHSPTASWFLDLACIKVKGKHWFLVGETLNHCQSFNLPRGWGFESRFCLRVGGKNSQGTSSVVGMKYCRVSKVVDQLFLTYLQWPNCWLPKKDSVKICWTPSFLIATTCIVGSFPLL